MPNEPQKHEFLKLPLGVFPRAGNDIGKCWHVVNMLYCGLPPDDEVHQVALTEPQDIVVEARGLLARHVVSDNDIHNFYGRAVGLLRLLADEVEQLRKQVSADKCALCGKQMTLRCLDCED